MTRLADQPRSERRAKQWLVAPPHADRDAFASAASIHPLLAQLLLNRGIASAASMRAYFDPDFRALHPPEQLPNAVEAAARLLDAAQAGKRIVIYGDYDVDGITATTILWHGLRLAGARVAYYIPRRLDEGYGLNAEALRALASDGAHIVVTVDCGVTATAEACLARELGIELIITDHHEPRAELPCAALIVHPTACPPGGSNPHLSGAGVALKIAWALAKRATQTERVSDAWRDYLLDATAFAALGLIADVVPLSGENRIIASWGLRHLCHTHNPGLHALIEAAGLTGKRAYDDYDVGFLLAPRLNAIGRLGHAHEAVELFTEASPIRAAEIAATLDHLNRTRQEIERRIVDQAEEWTMQRGFDRDNCRAIVLASDQWHAGVIGIVASRLVDRFHRPTVLIALDGENGQGSGRSVRHFPLHEALSACGEHLLGHGGHAMAAGLRISAAQVDAFTSAFQAVAAQRLTDVDLTPRLNIDDEVDLADLTPDVVQRIRRMAPFGVGNARPLLASAMLELAEPPRTCGANGAHLQFTVRQNRTLAGAPDNSYRRAIAFNRGNRSAELADQRRVRLAFEPIVNEWNGQRKVELKVADWQFV